MTVPEQKPEDTVATQSVHTTGDAAEKTAAKPIDTAAPDNDGKDQSVSLWMNLTIYIGTLFFPVIGIAMGFTYYRKNDAEKKRAGRNWLIMGVIVLLINIVLVSTLKRPEAGL